MTRIAIVGGGPGGLFTAHMLQKMVPDLAKVTIFEASARLGGKVSTARFGENGPLYEAGVAELYNYSHFGPDPIWDLIHDLGLKTVPMSGPAVVLDGKVLNTDGDIRRKLGAATADAIDAFHDLCAEHVSQADYYEGFWKSDNDHPWSTKTFAEVLDTIQDETARRYITIAAHTDVAAEPHETNALNGAKNVLMDNDEYLSLYSIEGGIERLVTAVAGTLKAEIRLGAEVKSVGKSPKGRYRLTVRQNGRTETRDFDLVVMALPNYWLQRVEATSRTLRIALDKHLEHYDRPAHYLRVAALFKTPFWRSKVKGSYFMQDSFGGACLYDEGSRHPDGGKGVLNWLLAGNDAMALSNLSDAELIARVLDSLPETLGPGRDQFIEARVHRWVGTINALPGSHPVHELDVRHIPEPVEHPGLYVVGDYMFDSTINGVYDSALFVTNRIMTKLRREKYHDEQDDLIPSEDNDNALGAGYHDEYAGDMTYEDSFEEYFSEHYNRDLIKAIWKWKPPYSLLDVGSANGLTIEAFDKLGIECWGIENSAHIHARTLPKWKHRNFLGDVRNIPFPDNHFDFVYDTCLCYIPTEDVDQAIRELFRVVRVGVFFGGITSDMTREVIIKHELFRGVQTLLTTWEWSERFLNAGFTMAIKDPKTLAKAWDIECKSNEGDYPWYTDAKAMRMCFYTKPGAPEPPPASRVGKARKR